jgi:hypothetical protein
MEELVIKSAVKLWMYACMYVCIACCVSSWHVQKNIQAKTIYLIQKELLEYMDPESDTREMVREKWKSIKLCFNKSFMQRPKRRHLRNLDACWQNFRAKYGADVSTLET